VDDVSAHLQAKGVACKPYHAGLTPEERRGAQELFAQEKCDLIVATVAFGMGIDRSNIRFVLHAAMPKSVEHYQQETGRAGRDGLEAECLLFHSAQDYSRWDRIMARSAEESAQPAETLAAQRQLLEDMHRLASGPVCRHAALSRYFGQAYEHTSCGACDVCLEEVETMAGAGELAQKVIACVSDLRERFGVGHVVD